MTDTQLQEIADKIIRLHAYSDRTGILVHKSIRGLLQPLNPAETSAVIDIVTLALPPRPSPVSGVLGGVKAGR
jgi:hypothetical protein